MKKIIHHGTAIAGHTQISINPNTLDLRIETGRFSLLRSSFSKVSTFTDDKSLKRLRTEGIHLHIIKAKHDES